MPTKVSKADMPLFQLLDVEEYVLDVYGTSDRRLLRKIALETGDKWLISHIKRIKNRSYARGWSK